MGKFEIIWGTILVLFFMLVVIAFENIARSRREINKSNTEIKTEVSKCEILEKENAMLLYIINDMKGDNNEK